MGNHSLKKKLFIFDCTGSSLLHMGFLQLWRAGATLCCNVQISCWTGFSCCRVRVLGCMGFSSCSFWAPELRLCSCGAWAQLAPRVWDLPELGIEPVSPALQGGFLTTGLPGQPQTTNFLIFCQSVFYWLFCSFTFTLTLIMT